MDVALGLLERPELPLGDCSLIGIQENVTYLCIFLKNSDQDLSDEGSNFILSLVEVGHWVAQT